jgi:hypothetical protein
VKNVKMAFIGSLMRDLKCKKGKFIAYLYQMLEENNHTRNQPQQNRSNERLE